MLSNNTLLYEVGKNMKNLTCLLIVFSSFTSFVIAEPFVVQGQLRDNGSIANDLYDFEFELWDASTSGSQIGTVLSFEDIDVVAGVFTVEVDFGAVFTGTPVWVQTNIRLGSSVGAFSPLPSRIQIGAAPQAQHAITADILLNPDWVQAPGVLWHGTGNETVLINRSSPVVGGEVFGVQNNGGFSGLVVSSPSNSSQPYIALAANNTVDTYQWYDGNTDRWIFWKSGAQRFYIDSANTFQMLEDAVFQGNVDIDETLYANSNIDAIGTVSASSVVTDTLSVSGNTSSDSFNYNTDQMRSVTISLWEFSENASIVPTDFSGLPPIVSVPVNFSAVVRAYVNIMPQAAKIVDIEVVYLDDSTRDDLVLTLISESILTGTQTVLAQTVSSGDSPVLQTAISPAVANTIVDNESNIYILDMNTVDGVWSDLFIMGIRAVIIHCEVSAPD